MVRRTNCGLPHHPYFGSRLGPLSRIVRSTIFCLKTDENSPVDKRNEYETKRSVAFGELPQHQTPHSIHPNIPRKVHKHLPLLIRWQQCSHVNIGCCVDAAMDASTEHDLVRRSGVPLLAIHPSVHQLNSLAYFSPPQSHPIRAGITDPTTTIVYVYSIHFCSLPFVWTPSSFSGVCLRRHSYCILLVLAFNFFRALHPPPENVMNCLQIFTDFF